MHLLHDHAVSNSLPVSTSSVRRGLIVNCAARELLGAVGYVTGVVDKSILYHSNIRGWQYLLQWCYCRKKKVFWYLKYKNIS
jgi:hypothetical protein